MTKKDTLTIGFMLFALFFGAGNLIYPPELGSQAGMNYWYAIAGFIITGVGLPIVAVTAIAFGSNDARSLGNRVHPLFGLIFTSVIYLAIGPFFGIPRAANVAYEMGVSPLVGSTTGSLWLFGFTIIFFALVFWISLNPSKIVDRVGQWLTPILLVAIVSLCVASFFNFDAPLQSATGNYTSGPLFQGFVNGYLTMDAIAGLAFGIIVVNALKDRGVSPGKSMIKETIKAGLVTATGLTFVYTSIGWMGAKMASLDSYDNGGDILSSGAEILFGSAGALILGLIVALACFTTCVGLTVACSQFFSTTFSNIKYTHVAIVVTLVSFSIANLGLNQIIAYSVPVLKFIYPLAIVLIVLSFFHQVFKGSSYVYRGALLFTLLFSVYDGLKAFGLELKSFENVLSIFPLFEQSLGWALPALIGAILGYLIDRNKNGTSMKASTRKVS
ncbi:branched-chain amino acid transport system II carrier protein [Pontibacillus yanchengensis]|uniref:Branched-chain amino acid transport system II carrier protein n=2 Tax=Pontibacillus yanchengensis TaxID=462910 RepID=A0ACC7VJU9_9BACI|nr:branched-chain amino acid transport system II carrier protein [Pontibacillus yanchengensis]MYL34588.1 branched-chain amino acid transport system II carrier protein [Pontibacillus yanchengensis]MYL54454.1 branched-chain amino acid transport system II carrier protein [Pontibacillus yanchengensis]